MPKNRSSAPTSCPWPCHTTRSPRTFPHNFTKSKISSLTSLSGLVHITYKPCVFVSRNQSKNSLRKLNHKKKPLAVAIASYTRKNFAQKQLFTHPTNHHKTTCQGLASCHTGPHRILSCPKQTIWSQFTSGKIENSHQKLLQNSLIRLWTCTVSKKPKSKLLPKFNIFLISSSKFLKQLARAGLGHALVLTICPRTPSAKLIEFERTFSHLVGRDLVPELAHHEHSWSTSSN